MITRIGLDHTAILGPDLQTIAREKLGIARSGIPVIVGPQNDELERWLDQEPSLQEFELHRASELEVRRQSSPNVLTWQDGVEVKWSGPERPKASPWWECFTTAIRTLKIVFDPSPEKLTRWVEVATKTQLAGRLDRRSNLHVGDSKTQVGNVVLDGGHNPDAVRGLNHQLKLWDLRRYVLILALARDKLIPELLPELSKLVQGAQRVVVTQTDSDRAASPEELYDFLKASSKISRHACLSEALDDVLSGELQTLVVAGSFYLVGEFCSVRQSENVSFSCICTNGALNALFCRLAYTTWSKTLPLRLKYMNKIWLSFISLVILTTSTAWAESPQFVVIDTKILNVRNTPQGKKLGRVFKGQHFQLLETKGDWGKIEFRLNQKGWVHTDYVVPYQNRAINHSIVKMCSLVNREFKKLRWRDASCNAEDWTAESGSNLGHPLLYGVLGEEKETTSILVCSVHSDEATAYHCFKLMNELQKHPEQLANRLVIVPLANPDGFLRDRKTRVNGRGVDLNRNLPTRDWYFKAWKLWKSRYNKDRRRFPGAESNSEPENQFLVHMFYRYRPDKIISIHSPLNFIDLDYADHSASKTTQNFRNVHENAKTLATQVSKRSKVSYKNYRTFPGSLGRFGDEWKIPIFTLELPSSDPAKAKSLHRQVEDSLIHSFNVILDEQRTALRAPKSSQNRVKPLL